MVKRISNKIGLRYGTYTVLEKVESTSPHAKWLCQCICGVVVTICNTNLKNKKCECEKTREKPIDLMSKFLNRQARTAKINQIKKIMEA